VLLFDVVLNELDEFSVINVAVGIGDFVLDGVFVGHYEQQNNRAESKNHQLVVPWSQIHVLQHVQVVEVVVDNVNHILVFDVYCDIGIERLHDICGYANNGIEGEIPFAN
jgi:hypothetical protein